MELMIKTELLKDLVVRAGKGVGNNKLIPLTTLMGIHADTDKVVLTTTDGTNYVYASASINVEEVFDVVVDAEKFAKLISLLTCEEVSLTLNENYLEVVGGRGHYKVELPLDENGSLVKFPNPALDFAEKFIDGAEVKTTINLTTIQSILNSIKPSLSNTLTVPCYTGYYVGDKVVATDTFKIASLGVDLLETPLLISNNTMNLLAIMEDETVNVEIGDNEIVFTDTNNMVYGQVMSGIEDYQINAINGLLDSEFDNMCKLSKQELLQVLDRLSLFVDVYDKNSITLDFTENDLLISSKRTNAVESIEYLNSEKKIDNFTCYIDIELFRTQVKAQVGDVVELWYGKENSIKLVNDEITYIVALLGEE